MLPVVVDVLREFRSREFKTHQARLFDALPSTPVPDRGTFASITDLDARESACHVSHYFDHVGLLVASGIAPAEPIVAFLGGTAQLSWTRLAPYIRGERQVRPPASPHYQEFFEHLVAVSWELGVGGEVAAISLRKLSEPAAHELENRA